MKNFNNFRIIENTSTTDNEIIEVINRDCKPFLDNGSDILYRGIYDNMMSDYSVFKRRKNRIPSNTSIHVQEILDELFYNKFGWKVRSSGVFATASRNLAQDYSQYSTPYIFIPIGEYNIVYNTHVRYILKGTGTVAVRYRGGGFFGGYMRENGVITGFYLKGDIKSKSKFPVRYANTESIYIKATAVEQKLLRLYLDFKRN